VIPFPKHTQHKMHNNKLCRESDPSFHLDIKGLSQSGVCVMCRNNWSKLATSIPGLIRSFLFQGFLYLKGGKPGPITSAPYNPGTCARQGLTLTRSTLMGTLQDARIMEGWGRRSKLFSFLLPIVYSRLAPIGQWYSGKFTKKILLKVEYIF